MLVGGRVVRGNPLKLSLRGFLGLGLCGSVGAIPDPDWPCSRRSTPIRRSGAPKRPNLAQPQRPRARRHGTEAQRPAPLVADREPIRAVALGLAETLDRAAAAR